LPPPMKITSLSDLPAMDSFAAPGSPRTPP
jgi:hypothetical protein